jgi:hypothetical protein
MRAAGHLFSWVCEICKYAVLLAVFSCCLAEATPACSTHQCYCPAAALKQTGSWVKQPGHLAPVSCFLQGAVGLVNALHICHKSGEISTSCGAEHFLGSIDPLRPGLRRPAPGHFDNVEACQAVDMICSSIFSWCYTKCSKQLCLCCSGDTLGYFRRLKDENYWHCFHSVQWSSDARWSRHKLETLLHHSTSDAEVYRVSWRRP